MAKIAVIETGGKQYVATDGAVLTIEKIDGEFKKGDKLTFDKVLLTDDGSSVKLGAPYISGAKISAEFVSAGRAKKINVVRYREKSRYQKKRGHRQHFIKVKVSL